MASDGAKPSGRLSAMRMALIWSVLAWYCVSVPAASVFILALTTVPASSSAPAAAGTQPMIAPQTRGVPFPVANSICRIACARGMGKQHPFFMKPWSGPEEFASSCATDPQRFAWYDAVKTSTEAFRNSIPTYGWTMESLAVTKKILAEGAPEKINCPVLLCTAENDHSVLPAPQEAFISRVPGGKHVFVKNARHEIFRSANEVLFPWWHEVLGFLTDHLPR